MHTASDVFLLVFCSERTVKESNDRALLKNLGVWLGLLTFGKNRPVLSKELELKKVLVEAYQRGRLIAVLPFMQKLLECCKVRVRRGARRIGRLRIMCGEFNIHDA
jgi:hypothetical protein